MSDIKSVNPTPGLVKQTLSNVLAGLILLVIGPPVAAFFAPAQWASFWGGLMNGFGHSGVWLLIVTLVAFIPANLIMVAISMAKAGVMSAYGDKKPMNSRWWVWVVNALFVASTALAVGMIMG